MVADGLITEGESPVQLSADEEKKLATEKLTEFFGGMMKALFKQKGASLDIGILASDEAQEFINTHASMLDSGFEKTKMSDGMRKRLQRSDWIFSGIKTFHELNEAFPSLLDENGERKSFERFLNDVQKIDKTYNRNYLRAEYNFVQSSAEMAAKWEQFSEVGDRYNLQYRTAGDDKVRPAHAELNGITLPASDSFWESYYPPNGWNCRCTVVQVRKSKYPATPHDEAMSRGESALEDDKKGIFLFNSGKEEKTVPDYNAYTIRRCRDCDIAKGKTNLAFVPENELCQACKLIHLCEKNRECDKDKVFGNRLLISKKADPKDLDSNITVSRSILSSFPQKKILVRPNVLVYKKKNPELQIDELIADNKMINGEKGVASAFKKAIEQGCSAIVLDLDARLNRLNVRRLANHISWRHDDFEKGIIKECYVVFNKKAILVTVENIAKENIMALLQQLKQ